MFRKSQMPLFSSFAEFDPGEMGMKAPGSFFSEPVSDGIEYSRKILLRGQPAHSTGVEVPKVDAG